MKKMFRIVSLVTVFVMSLLFVACGGGEEKYYECFVTIVYDANGAESGTVPIDKKNYRVLDKVTVLGNTGNLVRANYEFIGWNTSPQGDGISYKPGDTIAIHQAPDTIKLYAKWQSAIIITPENVDEVELPNGIDHFSIIAKGNFMNNFASLCKIIKDYSGMVSLDMSGVTGIEMIYAGAFENCRSLKSIILPKGIIAIADSAFRNCHSLTNVEIPDGVLNIGNYAFSSCENLSSITIPNSVRNIGGGAFYNCKSLTNITIPYGVTSIESGTFIGCTRLDSITIPETVKKIDKDAYQRYTYTWIKNINYIGSLKGWFYKEWSPQIFSYSYNLYIDGKKLTDLTIPDDITSISNAYISNCSSLTSLTIPESVTSISEGAFYGCDSLKKMTIASEITSLKNIFGGSVPSELKELVIKGEKILSNAFSSCKNITDITICESIQNIGDYAFSGCESLVSINIPNGVESIEEGTFYNCDSLTSITIPNSVKSIGDYAFSGCDNLTSITIPDSVECIGDRAFIFCYGLTSIIIPNNVTSIGSYAFCKCTNLTSITIPNGVSVIKTSIFSGCTWLTSITIPESVTSIEYDAFNGCKGLTSITIPKSVTNISSSAFRNCSNLLSAVFMDAENWNVDNQMVVLSDSYLAASYLREGKSFEKVK